MIATKKSISRRTVLRGIGTAIALPFLDAMVPALTSAQNTPAKPVRRFGVVYHPNGVIYDKWLPKGTGTGFELSPVLTPLEPFRDKLVVITGLYSDQAEALGDGGGGVTFEHQLDDIDLPRREGRIELGDDRLIVIC